MEPNKFFTGTMISEIPFINMPVLFKSCGLDFIIIDTEHGGFDYSTLAAMIMNARLCKLVVIIRLPDNLRRDITRMIDMGADGLLLPMTNCSDDIEQVVKYTKYAPLGKRGISTMRAHTYYNPPNLAEYMCSANKYTMVFAQIETSQGIDNIDSILAVNGVTGAMIGPNDLSCDLDCIDNDEPILAAIKHVATASAKYSKYSGIITAKESYLRCAKKNGLTYFSIGSELNMLKSGCDVNINRMRNY